MRAGKATSLDAEKALFEGKEDALVSIEDEGLILMPCTFKSELSFPSLKG